MTIQSVRFSNYLLLAFMILSGGAMTSIGGRSLNAQVPASNVLTVKLLDPIDSAQGQAGQRYHAAIAKDMTVGGISLVKGADATITLMPGTGGNRWTLNLVEVTINGKPVGVNGQNPTVVPTSAGDFFTMSKKTVTTRDRIAVAAGENIRFVLGPANAQPAPATASAAAPSPAPAAGPTVGPDQSAQYRAVAVAGPKPAPDALIGPAGAVLTSRRLKYEVRLDHCDRQGTSASSCDFTYLNAGDEREIRVGNGAFVAVDSKGQTIELRKQFLAGATGVGPVIGALAVPGLPGHVHFDYSGLDPDVTSLARVNLKIYEPPWNSWAEFEFRNVPLNTPPAPLEAFTPVPLPAPVAVLDQEGWKITVVRCSPLRRNIDPDTQAIECFIKVENEKADRSIALNRGTLMDEDGRVYFNSWYSSQNASIGGSPDRGVGFLGTEAVYSRVSAVPTRNTPYNGIQLVTEVDSLAPTTVKYGEPHYAFAVFSKLPTDVKRIAQLVCSFESEPPGYATHSIEFQFNDIPITPMPKLAAAPAAPRSH